MSLQNKFLTVVLVGLLSVYFVSVLYQRHSSVSTVSHFAAASKAGELERQWRWVDCVQQDMATGLEAIMATGDMDLFSQSMQQQAKLPGLVEASLTDFKARVQYSTIPSRRRQDLPVEVKQALWQNRQALKRQVDGDFEIYQPLIAQGNCVSCHTERRPGDILGVLTLRFTGKDLQAAEAKWDGFQTDFKRANAINSLLTGGILAVIMAILVIVCVRRFLDRPLHQAADDLAAESRQVNVAAGQLSESSQSLAAGASELAASLEESSASLAELTSTTARNNAHAEETRKLARLTHNAAQESVQRMEQLTTKIDQIKDSSNEIGKINKLINEIAFQTNLLALNAAVEAARAGEAGMGFAVVADEVRNLAQRCATAARETTAKVDGALLASAQGVEIGHVVAAALGEIVQRAAEVDRLANEVAGASQQQTAGISEINTAIAQMGQITQNNAASSEETAASAAELNRQARRMRESVQDLERLLQGDGAVLAAAEPAIVDLPPRGKSPVVSQVATDQWAGAGRR